MEERYIAAMILAGVGDAMGYKNGEWEFCFDGEKIHKEVEACGGVNKLQISKPGFIVSDDTVLLLSTADALIEKANVDNVEDLYPEIAFHYQRDFVNDMKNRAGGITTGSSCHALRPNAQKGWEITFNIRGGGCGAAMRAMCIGLRYPNVHNVKCLENLIKVSIESGRMTHNHPTGYLGSFATALFGALSICDVPVKRWGHILVSLLPKVLVYIVKAGRDVNENKKAWPYFQQQWENYLTARNILNGDTDPVFPEQYGVKERDAFYKSLAYSNWGGSSGHDAPMIAYDALLSCGGDWEKLCLHGMLHSGDNDSTGVIAGFCFGAMHGLDKVSECNYNNVEYKQRLETAGRKLFAISKLNGYHNFIINSELPIEKVFV